MLDCLQGRSLDGSLMRKILSVHPLYFVFLVWDDRLLHSRKPFLVRRVWCVLRLLRRTGWPRRQCTEHSLLSIRVTKVWTSVEWWWVVLKAAVTETYRSVPQSGGTAWHCIKTWFVFNHIWQYGALCERDTVVFVGVFCFNGVQLYCLHC